MKGLITPVVLTIALTLLRSAPAASDPQVFETVSIRPSQPEGDGKVLNLRIEPKTYAVTGATLKGLIADAYNLTAYQITGGPDWLDSAAYDVRGVSKTPANPQQLRVMLQNLLADRFALKFHREARDMPVYALTIAEGGPKFREMGLGEAAPTRKPTHVYFRDLATMAKFLSLYSSDRLVVDRTGLNGRYDIDVDLSGHQETGAGQYAVIQQEAMRQLGLKLVPVNARMEMFVIDSAQKPASD